MSFENIDQTFNVTSPAQLKLGNISGSVDIQAGQDGIIHVLAKRHPGNCDAEHTTIELLQAEDGSVSINTRFGEGNWSWLWGSQVCEVEYIIKAPHLCSINVNVVSSSINVKGFEGAFSFKSVSGDMALESLSGSLNVDTVSGDVTGQDLAGGIHLRSVSGDINLQASSLPSVNVNTVSGDVVLHTGLTEGPYKFHTVSGDVHLLVPAVSQFNVDLHSVSGDFTTNFPLTHSSLGSGRQSASVGKGGPAITLTSVSGDLQVETEGKIPPEPEVNKLDILSRLENGELSVDEALIQLNS
jgi:DUF4097 and DUF4098 domain-containing protein YvlB